MAWASPPMVTRWGITPMNKPESPTDFAGALTLIQDCVGGQAGERLLIVSEPEDNGMYDYSAPKLAAAAGRALGMTVYTFESESFLESDDEKAILLDSLRGFDHIVFFSRVGDQIRFSTRDELPPSTMCYTLSQEALKSDFGTTCHHGMGEIKYAVECALIEASDVRITCPLGTEFVGKPKWQEDPAPEVAVKRFPLVVPKPIPAAGFTGKVALSRFLIGTGSRYYDPYCLALNETVFACVTNNTIDRFEGPAEAVRRVEQHYLHVAGQLGIDPWFVDSWHAGIHAGCNFESDATTDIMRWSGTAFGSPRILHFHTCGRYAPGEICWNVLDPTVVIDGVPIWKNGRLFVENLPEGPGILAKHPKIADLFASPVRAIGLTG